MAKKRIFEVARELGVPTQEILELLAKHNINKSNLQTTISGTLANDPHLYATLSTYIPTISVLNDTNLSQILKNDRLNTSGFVHLLSLHKCE